jgi:hypothetical protein
LGHYSLKEKFMNVRALNGALLDFWVAKSEGLKLKTDPLRPGETHDALSGYWHPRTYHPSTDWTQGGPIVSRDWYELEDRLIEWFGPNWPLMDAFDAAPLKWFMRAFVSIHFGEQVEDMVKLPREIDEPAKTSRFHWFG